MFWWAFSFNENFGPELASPWGGFHSKSLTVVKLTRDLCFSGHDSISTKSQKVSGILWAMTRKLALSKPSLRSLVIFVNFSLQCRLELEDWYRAKSKLNCNRLKNLSCSASESLLWALIQVQRQRPKRLKSHLKRWLQVFDTSKRQPTWY